MTISNSETIRFFILQIEEVTADGERKTSIQKKSVEMKVILFHPLEFVKLFSKLLCKNKTKPIFFVHWRSSWT
jgi:hypothetical protein